MNTLSEPTITLGEAQKRLGVARTTLWRILKRYRISIVEDPLDGRVKRVRESEVERVLNAAALVRNGRAA